MNTTSKWFSFKVERATGLPADTIGAFPKLRGPIALLNTVQKIPTCFHSRIVFTTTMFGFGLKYATTEESRL